MRAARRVLISLAAVVLLAALFLGLRAALSRVGAATPTPVEGGALAAETGTPADARIRAGEGRIKLSPENPDGYNLLAAAYMQKARESGEFGFNAKAEEALSRSLAVAPDNYDALKLRAKLLLTFHRFREALEQARRAQALRPTDHDIYGALTDALVELGEYGQAVAAAQRMVDLRPDAASYSRVAYLRALHGDTAGAIEAMEVAVKAADPRDPEGAAWYRVQLGHELRKAGRMEEAEREYERALVLFPGHGMALEAVAHSRAAAGDLEGAVELYRRLPSHDAQLALGDLYTKLGRADEARRHYEGFEDAEREAAEEENDLSHLAKFWAGQGRNLDEALAIMRAERTRRRDIYTCDTLAWVLFRKGLLAEAKAMAEEALRLGTRDALINYHAGMIYRSLGDDRRAAKHLRLALEIAPTFDILEADEARRTLGSLRP